MMATTSDRDTPVVIKTEDKVTDADSLTAHINMLRQSETVQLPPNLLGDQAGLSLIGDGNGPRVSKHLNTYMCGSCGSQFNGFYAIMDLHSHVQTHGLGGSYYYDHRARTAYPKYDSVCSETQTATLTMKLKLKVAEDNVSSGRESNRIENNQPESGVAVCHLNGKRQLRKRKHKNNPIYDNSTGFMKKRTRGATNDESCLREYYIESSHAESTVKEPFTMSKSMCSEWTVVEQLESNGSGTETVDGKEFVKVEQDMRSSESGPGTQPGLKQLECKRPCNDERDNAVVVDSVVDLQETTPFKPEATLTSQSDQEQVDSDSCYPDLVTYEETGTVELDSNPCTPELTRVSQCDNEQLDVYGSASSLEFDVGAQASVKEVKHIPESTEKQTEITDLDRNTGQSELATNTDNGGLHDASDGIGGSNGYNGSGRPKRNSRKREYKTCDITPEKKVKKKVKNGKKDKVIQVTMPIRPKRGRSGWKGVFKGPRSFKTRGRFVSAETVQNKDNFFKVIKTIHRNTCFKCRLVFHNEDHLKIHIKKHFGSLSCDCCYKRFKNINKLQEHLNEEGKPMKAVKIFVCSVCGLIITELRGLVAHLCTSTMENELRKQVVRMYTDKIVNPTEDITDLVTLKDAPLDNMETRLQCATCNLEFENEYFLTMHSVVHSHTKKCRCRLCFMSEVDLALHKLSCEDRSAFKCKACGKEFATKANLKSHEEIHKENAICDKCGKTLSTPAGLKYHITSSCPAVQNRDRVICTICSKTYCSKISLKQHINSVHLDIRPFICEVCGTGFRAPMPLKEHMLTHQKDRQPINCTICGAGMVGIKSLARHMKLHTQGPRFTCETCGKHFSESWNMKAHLRQHTGEKPYKCGKCGEGFAHNVSRKNHMKKCCKVVADAML